MSFARFWWNDRKFDAGKRLPSAGGSRPLKSQCGGRVSRAVSRGCTAQVEDSARACARGSLNSLLIAVLFFANIQCKAQSTTVPLESLTPQISSQGPFTGLFRVARTGSTSQPLLVNYTLAGTARNGVTYRRLPGCLSIPAGSDSALIAVQPIDDGVESPPTTLDLSLAPGTRPFSIIVLPDSQYYVTGAAYLQFFINQVQWIQEHEDSDNIAFVLHEGDATEHNTANEWATFKSVITRLDGVVPYAQAVGNHDGLMTTLNDTALFNQFFPLSDYQNRPTFGGVFESNKMENAFHFFSAGGIDWVLITLEFGPRDVVLDWANKVVATNAARRVILLSHAHVYSDDTPAHPPGAAHQLWPDEQWH